MKETNTVCCGGTVKRTVKGPGGSQRNLFLHSGDDFTIWREIETGIKTR